MGDRKRVQLNNVLLSTDLSIVSLLDRDLRNHGVPLNLLSESGDTEAKLLIVESDSLL